MEQHLNNIGRKTYTGRWRGPLACFAVGMFAIIASGGSSVAQPADGVSLAPSEDHTAPRRWQVVRDDVHRYKTASPQASIVDTLAEGTVVLNLGCAEVSELVWCETRHLNGRSPAFVLRKSLVPAVGPDGSIPQGENNSKGRAGRGDFDASGQVACAQERGETLGLCAASVARSDGGDATVVVTFGNGFKRQLYFVHGQFVRAGSTMSGVGTDIEWRLDDARHHIRVDDQQFEIADAFLFGT